MALLNRYLDLVCLSGAVGQFVAVEPGVQLSQGPVGGVMCKGKIHQIINGGIYSNFIIGEREIKVFFLKIKTSGEHV